MISGSGGIHGLWYRHTRYRAGWSDGGRLLGHPLAGPGTECLLHGAVHDDSGGRWDLEMGLRFRNRMSENSFAPTLQGQSLGGFVNARRWAGPVDFYLQVDGERTASGSERMVGDGPLGDR